MKKVVVVNGTGCVLDTGADTLLYSALCPAGGAGTCTCTRSRETG